LLEIFIGPLKRANWRFINQEDTREQPRGVKTQRKFCEGIKEEILIWETAAQAQMER